ncbi:MAG TPA: hypothetical protein VF134_09445 [Candidatus Dormibacteraeota bacterium]
MATIASPGGFRFLPVDGPFSAGVAAEPGFRIVRVQMPTDTALAAGFRQVERTLTAAGRPLTALCAMELRIPEPLTADGFEGFNRGYVAQHEAWGLRIDGHLSAARTNVAPEVNPPSEPCLHAFCHTVEARGDRPTFVISGAPEPPGTEGGLPAYWAAMAQIMEERMTALMVGWEFATESCFYGTRADHEVFGADLGHFGELVRPGLRWFFARPPVAGLRLEIDVRGLAAETWL